MVHKAYSVTATENFVQWFNHTLSPNHSEQIPVCIYFNHLTEAPRTLPPPHSTHLLQPPSFYSNLPPTTTLHASTHPFYPFLLLTMRAVYAPSRRRPQAVDSVAHTVRSNARGVRTALTTARGSVIRAARARRWRFNSQKLRKMLAQIQADLQNTTHEVEAEVDEFIQSPHLLFQPIRMAVTLTFPMIFPLFFMPTPLLFLYFIFVITWYLICVLMFATEVAMRPPWYKKGLPSTELPPYWGSYIHDPKVDLGLDFENVEFMSASGVLLRGWFILPEPSATPLETRNNMVVFVHGVGRDRRNFLRHAQKFLQHGFPCLLFDLSEHGLSDGISAGSCRGTLFGAREQYDVLSAVDYLTNVKCAKQVAIVGTSCGASSAILAAARKKTAAACVVAENPFSRADELFKYHLYLLSKNYLSQNSHQTVRRAVFWLAGKVLMLRMGYYFQTFGAIDAVQTLTCPLLVAHSTADDIVPYEHGRDIFEAALASKKGNSDMVQFLKFTDAAHCALYDKNPNVWSREVISFVSRSFDRNAKSSTVTPA